MNSEDIIFNTISLMISDEIVIDELNDDDIFTIISIIPSLVNHPFINKRLNNS